MKGGAFPSGFDPDAGINILEDTREQQELIPKSPEWADLSQLDFGKDFEIKSAEKISL